MKDLAQEIQSQVNKVFKKHLFAVLQNAFDVEHGRMKKGLEIIQSNEPGKPAWDELQQFVIPSWTSAQNTLVTDCLPQLISELQNEFELLDESQTLEQPRERFYPLEDDKAGLRFLKWTKRQLFHLSKLHITVPNKFRKGKKPVKFWSQIVLVKNLAVRHFQNELLMEILEILDFHHRKIDEAYFKIRIYEESLSAKNDQSDDQGNLSSYLDALNLDIENHINERFDLLLKERSNEFLSDFAKGGTIELFNRSLSTIGLDHEKDDVIKKWQKRNENWNNTRFAFFENWRLDLELYLLKWSCEHEFELFTLAQSNQLTKQIQPIAKSIQEHIDRNLAQLGLGKSELGKQLREINGQAENELNRQWVPKLIDKLANKNIITLVNKLELNIKGNVEELTDERIIVKDNTFQNPLPADELKKISPNELISFEALIFLEKEIAHHKQRLFTGIDAISLGLSDIGQIISFSCESALVCLEEEGKTPEESFKLAFEGITRAKNRLVTSLSELEVLLNDSASLKLEIDKFTEALLELTINQNISELRLRLTKAKAAKQAEELKKEFKEKIYINWRRGKTIVKGYFTKVKRLLEKLSSRFILTAAKPIANREISDFLVESQNAIDKLPLIYRRLYKIEPLTDLDLFEGREQELEQLKNAYKNWSRGRFAATAIVGEKLGGLSTFINYLVDQSNYPSVIRHAIQGNTDNQEELLEKLASILGLDSFESIDQVIKVLNAGGKRVIILEDLQHLYFRKIGGFEALIALCQIIANTGKNVYWVTTFTLYSWQYLSKTIQIQDFFSYVVQMGALSDAQIVNLIWKRNRISGFNIEFEPDEALLKDKKFRKLEESDHQKWLKDRYFTSLNGFAKSNISLALIFWLLSTKRVDKTTITIGTFQRPDFNFISILSATKVHVLLALILHDGLNDEQLISFLGTPESSSKLMLLSLLEDGILLKKDDTYMVNPLVYRNTISMLTSKNLLH